MDGRFDYGGESGDCSDASRRRQLLDLHRRRSSGSSVGTGGRRVPPGLIAYQEGLEYLELEEPMISSSAPSPWQRQFYRVDRPATAALQAAAAAAVPLPAHLAAMQAHGRRRNIRFPTPAAEEAAMVNAMLAVISSRPSTSSSPSYPRRSVARRPPSGGGAFEPYVDVRRPPVSGVERRCRSGSQVMFKKSVDILRQIMSSAAASAARRIPEARAAAAAASTQLHHRMSERKWRERLSESFAALWMLLPPGTKKDKASVLAGAREYVNRLKSKISELEEKNRRLTIITPKLCSPADETGAGDIAREPAGEGGSRRIEIIRSGAGSSSETERIELRVTTSTVLPEISCTENAAGWLVLHVLKRIKEMGRSTSLLSLEARSYLHDQMNTITRATFSLQIKRDEWDQGMFQEAIAGALDEAALDSE